MNGLEKAKKKFAVFHNTSGLGGKWNDVENCWTNKRMECLFHIRCGVQWQGTSWRPKVWMGSKWDLTISWNKGPPRTVLASREDLNWWISRTWERIEPHLDCCFTPSLSICHWPIEAVCYLLKWAFSTTKDGCSFMFGKVGTREGEMERRAERIRIWEQVISETVLSDVIDNWLLGGKGRDEESREGICLFLSLPCTFKRLSLQFSV